MIQGISAGDPIFGSPEATGPSNLNRDSFMRLLVAQLQNQDPLEPQANEDFIAQLAQFSSLEEMQGVNENLVGLAVLQQSNALMGQLTDSSVLIGKEVQFIDPSSNAPAFGAVTSVKIQDGLAILRIDGKDIPLANVTEVGGAPPEVEPEVDPDDTTE